MKYLLSSILFFMFVFVPLTTKADTLTNCLYSHEPGGSNNPVIYGEIGSAGMNDTNLTLDSEGVYDYIDCGTVDQAPDNFPLYTSIDRSVLYIGGLNNALSFCLLSNIDDTFEDNGTPRTFGCSWDVSGYSDGEMLVTYAMSYNNVPANYVVYVIDGKFYLNLDSNNGTTTNMTDMTVINTGVFITIWFLFVGSTVWLFKQFKGK